MGFGAREKMSIGRVLASASTPHGRDAEGGCPSREALARLSGAARCLSSHVGGRDDGAGHALQHHGLCYELLARPPDRDAVGVFREEPDDPAAGGGVVSGPYW